jgi:hypothetical protein
VLGILTKYDLSLIKLSELAEHQDKIITLPLYISFLCALYIAKFVPGDNFCGLAM